MKEVRIEFDNSLQRDSSNKDSSQVIQLDNLNIREEMTKVLKEQEEKKIRKNNIVLYNISESMKQNAKERDKEDLEKTKELISQGIKVEGCRIEKIIRLGRTTKEIRSRPILVKMKEEGDKWNLLKNAEGWQKKVGVSTDISVEERVKERVLVKQLKLKRESGEKGWYIYRGTLCRRDF